MAISQMQYVVLATTALITLNLIISHVAKQDIASNDVWDDPVWQNFTDAFNADVGRKIAAINGSLSVNETDSVANLSPSLNSSSPAISTQQEQGEDTGSRKFYFRTLPRAVLVYALLVPLQYYWNIFLERCLPTRPRGRAMTSRQLKPSEKPGAADVIGDADGGLEEEIIKRWIAQGKVKRSSVSVCNTLSKWILDITVGKIIYEIVWHAVDALVQRDRKMVQWWYLLDVRPDYFPRLLVSYKQMTILANCLLQNVLSCLFGFFFSLEPVISLVGFILIPAKQRVVFCAGMALVASVFIKAFWRLVTPWFIKNEFAQERMREMTEGLWQQARKEMDAAAAVAARQIDEL